MKAGLCLLALGALAGTGLALDFGGLTDGLNKLKKGLDTAKDVGTVLSVGATIPLEQEKELGQSAALEVISRFGGLVRDPEITRRVNLVGRALARYSDRPELDWRFAVLRSETVNAFSTPGGYVFITQALYRQATSDDALAGVLGHEITHIARRHPLKSVQIASAKASADRLGSEHSAQYRNAKADVAQVSETLRRFDGNVGNIVGDLIEHGYDQPTEFSADDGGRKLALTTGYAGGGLRSVLVQLKSHGGDSRRMFSTHPPLDERIRRLPDEPVTGMP